MFNLHFQNIPLINLRNQFDFDRKAISSSDFQKTLLNTSRYDNLACAVAFPEPNAFLSFLIRQTISSFESYLPGAVYLESGRRGVLTQDTGKLIQNPFKLGGKNTVEKYFHLLPCLVDNDYSLKTSGKQLFGKTEELYKNIRNPIFHGKEISKVNETTIIGMVSFFDHISLLYDWIDEWHSLDAIMKSIGTPLHSDR